MLIRTCDLGNRALIQHHLSNSLLVDLNFIYVHHLCKGAGFQAPCSLITTSYLYDMDGLGYIQLFNQICPIRTIDMSSDEKEVRQEQYALMITSEIGTEQSLRQHAVS